MLHILSPVKQRYAQVEKEALGLTLKYKPLLSLLGAQAVDALPPRIQHFRMRLMRYSYLISHVPGKNLWTADTLSHVPLQADTSNADKELMESTNIYICDNIMENLPMSPSYIDSLRQHLKEDSVCSKVMKMCHDEWPEFSLCEGTLKRYWVECAFLTVQDGLLLKGTRLVIPAALRNDVSSKLHEGHQGVTKCKEGAQQSMWWSGLSQQLNELVLNSGMCIKERTHHTEPLIPGDLPD